MWIHRRVADRPGVAGFWRRAVKQCFGESTSTHPVFPPPALLSKTRPGAAPSVRPNLRAPRSEPPLSDHHQFVLGSGLDPPCGTLWLFCATLAPGQRLHLAQGCPGRWLRLPLSCAGQWLRRPMVAPGQRLHLAQGCPGQRLRLAQGCTGPQLCRPTVAPGQRLHLANGCAWPSMGRHNYWYTD